MSEYKNHKYYYNIIELCNFINFYDNKNECINNIISLLLKSINIILDKTLQYSDNLYKCYINLQEIKSKCIVIIRNYILLNKGLNNETINIQIDNINDYLQKLNNFITEINDEYNSVNLKNDKLLKFLYEINNLKINDDTDINLNVYLKYNSIINLLYIPEDVLINMLKKIIDKYNNLLILYNQIKDLILNYQNKLYNKHIINKIVFSKEYLNIDLNLF